MASARAAEMANPTLVIVTDRNDLDDQLFDTFAMGRDLLRQEPVQADSREHLKQLLDQILHNARHFAGGRPMHDDLTLVAADL